MQHKAKQQNKNGAPSIEHYLFNLSALLLGMALVSMMLVIVFVQTSVEQSTITTNTRLVGKLLIEEMRTDNAFHDQQQLARHFRSLQVHSLISSACLYNEKGLLIAEHYKTHSLPCSPEPKREPSSIFNDYLQSSQLLPLTAQSQGQLILFADQKTIWEHVLSVLLPFSFAGLAIFLAAMLIGKRLAVRALLGLRQLRDSAIQISKGEPEGRLNRQLKYRFKAEGPQEVRDVATAFNTIIEGMLDAQHIAQEELTQHQITQHTLIQTETLLRNIIDLVPYTVFAVREDGSLEFANKALAEIYGTNISSLLNGSFQKAHHKDGPDGLLFAGQEASHAPQEIWLNNADGKTRRYIITRTSFHPVNATHASILVIAIDITERRRLQVQLQFSQRLEVVGTLAGGIAHDFNNLLTPIMGYTTILLDGDLSEDTRKKLEGIYIASIKARDLVQQILTFSRQNDDNLEKKKIQAEGVLDQAVRLLRSTIPTTIAIETLYADNIQPILADAGQISQVIANLCTNSAQALSDTRDGFIKVRIANSDASDKQRPEELEQGEYIKISVEDNGQGMRKDIVTHVFEPFFTTKAVGEGSGLGLSVVHGIVTNHGGKITVNSTIGRGTTFVVYLPTVKQSNLPMPQKLKRRDTVILVDDEITILRATKDLLDQSGYKVHAFVDAQSALECFKESPDEFDILLTDNFMPYMSGLDLAHAIKEIRPDLPIVLISGFIDKPADTDPSIDYRVMKPVSGRDLSRIISEVILNTAKTAA
ncbi:MAG: response regulator [Pseudomonadales bacterium]|nr:response regulator [Pseudomonadales bacterium]